MNNEVKSGQSVQQQKERLHTLITSMENCDVWLRDIDEYYTAGTLQDVDLYVYSAKKTMLLLLEKAVEENLIRLEKITRIQYGVYESSFDNMELEEDISCMFEDIMTAYGWQKESFLCPYLSGEEEPYMVLYESLVENGMEQELLDMLTKEGVIETIGDSCYEETGEFLMWHNDRLSEIIMTGDVKKLPEKKQMEFDGFLQNFLHMKRRDLLAHLLPIIAGKNVYFCYMHGMWHGANGELSYSGDFYLKQQIPLYAALLEYFIDENFD